MARHDALNQEQINEILSLYKAGHVQTEIARITQHSITTVNKYIVAAGLGKGIGGNQKPKISDAVLSKEAKSLTSKEIAIKYNMSEERVYKRAKKLGIELQTSWVGGHWRRRARRYGCSVFDSGITLRAVYVRDFGICQICGKPTDQTDIKDGHIRRNYPTLDHIIPLSKGGAHSWENVQLAHMACNAGKCDKEG